MSENDCALCTVQQNCAENPVFLYAATPILRDIVASHLNAVGATFRVDREIFAISGDQDVVIRALRQRLADAERADIRVTRQRGAAIMAAPLLDQWDRDIDTSWFDRAVQEDAFTSFFQPIVDTADKRVFAHECLIRLFTDRPHGGAEIMSAAVTRGRVHLFDAYARKMSIRKAAAQYQTGTKIFINFLPSSIYDPAYCMRSTMDQLSETTMRPEDIVFEVVESEQVTDVKHLRKICDYYHKQNFGFALDDVGTGSNSFQMMCDLEPDYIKLDKSLVTKIHEPMYYSAVGKLNEFACQYSLKVIAEGIEDPATMEKLRSLGIHLMQGYYFGKPSAQMASSANDLVQLASKLTSLSPQSILTPHPESGSAV